MVLANWTATCSFVAGAQHFIHQDTSAATPTGLMETHLSQGANPAHPSPGAATPEARPGGCRRNLHSKCCGLSSVLRTIVSGAPGARRARSDGAPTTPAPALSAPRANTSDAARFRKDGLESALMWRTVEWHCSSGASGRRWVQYQVTIAIAIAHANPATVT